MESVQTGSPVETFSTGIAGYSFSKIPVNKAIEIMKRAGVANLALKDVYLPLNSTKETIATVIDKFKAEGINVYAVGVIYMKTIRDVDQAFEYAQMAGVRLITGAPDHELLPYVEEKVKEYKIRLAIHNHGPDNPLYPNVPDIWSHIRDMDQRIGICIDIGHTTRDGKDPADDIKRYGTRIYDVHIKDVTRAAKEGTTIEMGRGIINIPKVVAALRKIKYTGMCSLEFEKDMNDPLAGIAESIGYWKGVCAALK
ncbi:MAG: xylose isomerase [Odoribacter sp.]|nr:xylose isomerase [Odoribacter sp.]